MIEVGALCDLLVAELAHTFGPTHVGDQIAPVDGGWIAGQPNVKAFRPYVVVVQGPATSATPDRIVPSHSEWLVSFSVRSFGGSPAQVRTVAQQAREALDAIKPATLFGVADIFGVVHLHFDQLGSVIRDDAVDPPYWQVFDAVRVEVSRSRLQP